MAESKNEVLEFIEIEKDLQESLVRAIDRSNKAEKDLARLSDGDAVSQLEKERQDDLRVRLQKQVRSVDCMANVLHSIRSVLSRTYTLQCVIIIILIVLLRCHTALSLFSLSLPRFSFHHYV